MRPVMPVAVSVVLPSYNSAEFVAPAVRSVLAQTFGDYELLVVDDGSTDDSLARLRAFAGPRVEIFHQPNAGPSAAMNAGIEHSQGRYVAFLDGDDVWAEMKLERQVAFLEAHPDVALCFCWSQFIDAAGRRIGLQSRRWRGPVPFERLFADFVIGTTSSVVMRRAVFDKVGLFDPQLRWCYDVDLFLRVARLGPRAVHAVPEDLALYRRRPGQMSANWRPMQRELQVVVTRFGPEAAARSPRVIETAETNMARYLSLVACEQRDFRAAGHLLWRACGRHPAAFLADWRNWIASGATIAGVTLPGPVHRLIERLGHAVRTS
jgi:glycosyltransferase involved in cell wall biosynthesis